MSTSSEQPVQPQRSFYRRFVAIKSKVMMVLCGVGTSCILALLALVTFYLLVNGLSYLNWSVFTELPIPTGMAGAPGGLKNSLIGTLILIGMASVVGIPVGVLAGIYLSEYSTGSWLG